MSKTTAQYPKKETVKRGRGRLRKNKAVSVVEKTIKSGQDLSQVEKLRKAGVVKVIEPKTVHRL
jgi:hypothetical protein